MPRPDADPIRSRRDSPDASPLERLATQDEWSRAVSGIFLVLCRGAEWPTPGSPRYLDGLELAAAILRSGAATHSASCEAYWRRRKGT